MSGGNHYLLGKVIPVEAGSKEAREADDRKIRTSIDEHTKLTKFAEQIETRLKGHGAASIREISEALG